MSHVTHFGEESCHVTHVNESCHTTYECARTLPMAELGGLSHAVCARVSYMSPTHSHEPIRTRTQCILKIPRYSRNDEPSEGGAKLCVYTYIYIQMCMYIDIF